MSKFRTSILIIGLLVIVVAASLLTVLALYASGAVVTEQIELVYTVTSLEKDYDGTPLVADEYELVSGELLNDHYAVVEFTGSQTDAGQSRSSLNVKIYDKQGHDVTNEYKIGVNSGLLKVKPRPISVVLNDEEVTYNGSKVSFENYAITDGELVNGHRIAGAQSVQLLNVDDVVPSDLEVIVLDATGKEVTKNYKVDFTYNEKRIKIVKRPLIVKPVDKIKVYDGEEINLNEVEIIGGSLAEGQYIKSVEINNGKNRPVDVADSDLITRVTHIVICQRVGSEEVVVTKNYDIDTAETGIVRIEARPLTVVAKSGTWEYDGTSHDYLSDHTLLSYEGLAPNEVIAGVDYSGTITDVGTVKNKIETLRLTNTALNKSATIQNYNVTYVHGTLTIQKREVTIITPTVSKTYDGTPLLGASLNVRPQGLNLAPEHEVIYVAEKVKYRTDVGTDTNDTECIIVDQKDKNETRTDLSKNYKITYSYGTLTVSKRPARISTRTVSKVYDGTPLVGYKDESDLETYGILSGHKLELSKAKSYTDVNRDLNTFDVKIIGPNQDGQEVDLTDNYDIDRQYGYIEVTRLNVTIRTLGYTGEYDGTAIQFGEANTEFEGLPDSLKAVLVTPAEEETFYPSVTNVTSKPVVNLARYKLVFKKEDEDDGEDYKAVNTDNYRIDYVYGNLVITPCEININLKNKSQIYNGKSIILDMGDVLGDSNLKCLNENNFEFDSSITEFIDAGTYTYSVKLKDQDIKNFNLRISNGTVVITKCDVEVKLKDYTDLVYSGEAQAAKYEDITIRGIGGSNIDHLLAKEADPDDEEPEGADVDGDEADGEDKPVSNKPKADLFEIINGTFTNAGTYTYTVRFTDSSFTRNHELYIYGGNVTIGKKEIIIELYQYNERNKNEINYKTYTGKSQFPEASDAIIITEEKNPFKDTKLSAADFVIVPLNGDAINASDTAYTYTVAFANSRNEENYELKVTDGSVKIVKAKVALKLIDKSYDYDGSSRLPKVSDLEFMGTRPEHLKDSMLQVVVISGDDEVKNFGTYKYSVEFKDATDAANHALTLYKDFKISETATETREVANAQIVIKKCEVKVTIKNEEYRTPYDGLNHAPSINEKDENKKIIVFGELPSHLPIYKFEVVASGEMRNAGTYTYTIAFKNDSDNDNNTIILVNGDGEELLDEDGNAYDPKVIIDRCEVRVTLKSVAKKEYDNVSHVPKFGGEEITFPKGLPTHLSISRLEVVASGDIKNVGEYTYTVSFRNPSDEDNYDLIILKDESEWDKDDEGNAIETRAENGVATYEIIRCVVSMILTDREHEYSGSSYVPKIASGDLEFEEPLPEHISANRFEVVTSGDMRSVGIYTYYVAFRNPSDEDNYELVLYGLFKNGEEDDGEETKEEIESATVTVTKFNIEMKLPSGLKYDYNGKSQLPKFGGTGGIEICKMPENFSTSRFEIVASGDMKNAGDYTYTVEFRNPSDEENYEIILINANPAEGDVENPIITEATITIIPFKVTIKLTTGSITYDSKSHLPKINDAESVIFLTMADHVKRSMFEIVADGDIRNVGKYTYTIEFRNSADEDNYELTIVDSEGLKRDDGKATITVEPCLVTVGLNNLQKPYTAAEHSLSFNEEILGVLSCDVPDFITPANVSRYFELYCPEAIKNAKIYSYGLRYIYRDDMENITLKVETAGESEMATYEVTKISVTLESTIADGQKKTYDGEVYTVDTDSAIASNSLKLNSTQPVGFGYSFTVVCKGNDPSATEQTLYFSNLVIYNSYGENITSNFDADISTAKVEVEITPRDITFTLSDYFYSGDTPPYSGSPEYLKCLGVSAATPLLSGYTVNFEEVNLTIQNGNTLITYDIEYAIIYDREGHVANDNFRITNLDDVSLSSRLIKIG